MKTFLAAVVSIAFASSAAMACPHDGAEAKVVKKEDQTKTKQADAKAKPAPAPAAPVKPAPAPAAPVKPKADAGKVSSAK